MKGFLIQARRIDPGTDQDTPVGTFSVTDPATTQAACTTMFVSKRPLTGTVDIHVLQRLLHDGLFFFGKGGLLPQRWIKML